MVLIKDEKEVELVGIPGSGQTNVVDPFPRRGMPLFYDIVSKSSFDMFIIACILINSIFMACEDPRAECKDDIRCDGFQHVIYIFEYIFLAIYIVEMIMKILGLTFAGYIADAWNRIDCGVVIIGIVSLFIEENLSMLRTVRLLRTMRTLNIIPSMRAVARSMLQALPSLNDVLMLCIFMLVIFTVFGLQMFRGEFRNQCVVPALDANGVETYANYPPAWDTRYCRQDSDCAGDPSVTDPLARCLYIKGDKYGPCTSPLEDCAYVNPYDGNIHYDNFGYAFLTVFLLTTAEGWTEIMYFNQDASGDWVVIYYLLVIWIGALITISLALAALEAAWGDDDDEDEEGDEEEAAKGRFSQVIDNVLGYLFDLEKKYSWAKTEVGVTCKAVAQSNCFDWLVFYAIVTNTLVLALERADMTENEADALEEAGVVFLWFFVIEMIIKILGFGIAGYFYEPMNRFDFVVVVVSLIEKYAASGGGMFSVFRALRLLRVLKLVRSWTKLRRLVKAMANSLKAASALTMILILFMYIFALVGKEFFAYKLTDYNERYNYDNFEWAIVTVFVVLSGENWNALMFEVMTYVSPWWSIYFVIIMIVGGYIVLNLFIAIVLDELMDTRDDEFPNERTMEITDKEAWIAKQMKAMFKKPLNGRQAAETDVEEAESDTPVDQDVNKVVLGEKFKGVFKFDDKDGTVTATRDEILRQGFDMHDTSGNGKIEESEVESLLQDFGVKLTMLEYHVLFADDHMTFEEFKTIMDKHHIDVAVDDANQVKVSARGKHQNFTSAEAAILKEFDIDATLIVPPDMEISDEIIVDPNSRSFFIFHAKSRIRQYCKGIAESSRFNNFILFAILASTVCVALDEPRRSCNFKKSLDTIDLIFTIIFMAELLIKSIAMEFILGKNSYLRSSHFNKLDFLVVAMSVATLFINASPCAHNDDDAAQIGALKALRAFRALRPLRTVGRVENLKVVVNALMQSALPIANVLALMLFFFLMFAILGVQFFAGKFNYCRTISETTNWQNTTVTWNACPDLPGDSGYCQDPLDSSATPYRCRGSFETNDPSLNDCFSCAVDAGDGTLTWKERKWDTYDQNFDNTAQALVVLFEMSTLEAWPSIALYGVDSTGTNTWPDSSADSNAHNMIAFAYFIVFILMGTFFVANLFASVACDKHDKMSEFYSGMLFLTEEQKVWVVDSKQVWNASPKKYSTAPMIPEMEKIVTNPKFDNFIMWCIVANIIVMSIEYEGMSDSFSDWMYALNVVFVVIFTIEMLCKVTGLGPEAYIAERFNVFDAVVVVASLVSLASALGPIASIFRIFRVARVLKLIPRAERLMAVVMTVYHSMPALINVGLLTALFFLIFACLGVSLFGEVVYGVQLSRHANFETFPVAMLTLFRIATGEDWNGMMYDLAIEEGQYNGDNQQCTTIVPCPSSYEGQPCGCGINYVSQVFLIIFNVLAAFVMLNLVVAAILTHYDIAIKTKDGLSDMMIQKFKDAWWELDKEATARIKVSEFDLLYAEVHKIFPDMEGTKEACDSMLKKMEVVGGELRFSEVLFVFAFESFGQSLGYTPKARELEKKITKKKYKLDDELPPAQRPIFSQLTEMQISNMTADDLREELRRRGQVRLVNMPTLGEEEEENRRQSLTPSKA